MPKFLERIAFNPGAAPGRGDARPCIVQYHSQATSEVAKRQGYILAYVEPWAAEHGPSLAAGPAALDLLDRLVAHFAPVYLDLTPTSQELVDEAKDLLDHAKPPIGSVNPNGTARHAAPHAMKCAVCGSGMRRPARPGEGGGERCAKCGHDGFIPVGS